MCDALYELFADQLAQNRNAGRSEGLIEGLAEGRIKGRSEGENRISNLILKLISDNRNSDIERIAADPVYRQTLINEYHL